jgi:hypothetical protein
LSDLARFLVREFDNEDPAVMEAGVTNLAVLMDAVDYEASTVDRSTIPAHLEAVDVERLTRPPETFIDRTVDVSVSYLSRHTVSDHIGFTDEDQLPAEPTAVEYTRDVLEGDCFAAGDCDHLRTFNDLTRENGLFSVRFDLFKDFRAMQTDDGRDVMVSWAWTEESFLAHVGTAHLKQSWTLDVWLEKDGGAERLRVNWAETTFDPPVEDDVVRNTTRGGIQDALEAADDVLD